MRRRACRSRRDHRAHHAPGAYNDFLRPQGLGTGVGVTVFQEHGRSMAASVLFEAYRGETASPDHVRLLGQLVPHLERAARIHRALAGAAFERRTAEESLDRLSLGAIVLDRDGRVLIMNRAARRITEGGDGLAVGAGGRLEAAHPEEGVRLRRLIRSAALTAAGKGTAAGDALFISRPSLRPSYSVLVAPLRRVPDMLDLSPTAAILFVSDPEGRARPVDTVLQALYGLTRAEAKIAAALVGGEALRDIAERSRTSEATVRQHVKAVLAKTETHRQSDLVRLILTGPAALECDLGSAQG